MKALGNCGPEYSDERGSTIVEHAIVLQVFFFLILVSLELLRVLYHHLALQYAVSEASRKAVVQTADAPAAMIRDGIAERLASLGVPLRAGDTVVVCPVLQISKCKTASQNYSIDFIVRGGPQESVVFEIHRLLRAFMFGNLDLTARVVAKNEPEA